MNRALPVAAVLLTAGAFAAWWATQGDDAPPAVSTSFRTPKHVVIVSIDTLRADHLGAYGHPRARTPFLDRLASEGVVFEQHISAAPTTLASHMSLFTGNHAHTHGAAKNDFIVNDDNVMLQEVLDGAGFTTAAFIGAVPIASHSNFTQGFDHVDEAFTLHRKGDGVAQTMRDGKEVTNAALAWVDDQGADEPVFLFAHYFDVHSPYLPPEPWRGWYKPDGGLPRAGTMKHIHNTRKLIRAGDPEAERHSNALKELYLGGVSYADHQVGRLLTGLSDAGILDDALVIITSDHGETFDTHSELWDHGYTVYDETVHTPLIVRLPGAYRGGTRVPEQVSAIDLFPSITALLEVETDPVEGLSWADLLLGEAGAERPPAFSEATKPGSLDRTPWKNDPMQKSIRSEGMKLIHTPRKKGMNKELFDLTADPGELENLAGQDAHAPTQDALQATLDAWRAEADPLPTKQSSDARIQAELAALGYVDDAAMDDEGQEDDEGEE